MADIETDYDVVVIGGGVSGCASAYRLAPDHDVAVVDKGQIAGEASGLAAGLVAPTLFYSDNPAVARYANAWFREFDGTGQFTFHQRPRLEFIRPDSADAARERAGRLSEEGFPVTFLDPPEVDAEYPWFDTSRFVGAVEYADTGWVDPYEYTVALQKAAVDRGVDVSANTPVSGVDVNDGVVSIELDGGTLTADYVVVAAGWRTRELLADYIHLPVQPFRLQCAMLRPEEPLDRTFPLGRVARNDLYFRGEPNGDLLVGGGEYLDDTPDPIAGGVGIDDDFRQHVATTVPTFLEGFERAEFVNGWAGIDATTPDTFPLLGSAPSLPDRIIVSTGYNGLGMVSSPVGAAVVHAEVTGEDAPFPVDPFAVDRFSEDTTDFELRGTFEMAGAGR